jgi:hypothetical protein
VVPENTITLRPAIGTGVASSRPFAPAVKSLRLRTVRVTVPLAMLTTWNSGWLSASGRSRSQVLIPSPPNVNPPSPASKSVVGQMALPASVSATSSTT